jgi:hypothetical protein
VQTSNKPSPMKNHCKLLEQSMPITHSLQSELAIEQFIYLAEELQQVLSECLI